MGNILYFFIFSNYKIPFDKTGFEDNVHDNVHDNVAQNVAWNGTQSGTQNGIQKMRIKHWSSYNKVNKTEQLRYRCFVKILWIRFYIKGNYFFVGNFLVALNRQKKYKANLSNFDIIV